MEKLLRINVCNFCFHKATYKCNPGYWLFQCQLSAGRVILHTDDVLEIVPIPNWCKLEDAQSNLKARAPEDFTSLQTEIGLWGEDTLGHSRENMGGIIAHLRKEIDELESSFGREEVADCVILLCSIAHLCSVNIEQAVREKHEVNKNRKWGQPDSSGVIEHIKEGPTDV